MAAQAAHQHQPRLTVVGQFRMVVEAVARTLAPSARVKTIVLESSLSTAAARDAVLRTKPDAVVLVLAPADTVDAHGVVGALAGRGQRVVVTGELGDRATPAELLDVGAAAYLGAGVDQVRRLVGLVLRRRSTPRPRSLPAEPPLTSERRIRQAIGSLTAAEERVLWRLMLGRSVQEIAREHVVSVETVRSQIRTVLAKMGAPSQLVAVAQAWSVGWRPAVLVAA